MIKNNSYSGEFKLKVVKKYLEGNYSLLDISNNFGIRSTTQVYSWVKKYKEKGDNAFKFETRGNPKQNRTIKENSTFKNLEDEIEFLKIKLNICKRQEDSVNDIKNLHFIEFFKKEIRDNLEVVFQPIFSLKENKILKYEVLSRFRCDKFKNLSTLEAITILEKLDLIHFLDFLVLEKIKMYLSKDTIKLSVNISPKTVEKPQFVDAILQIGESLNNLELEIIERHQICSSLFESKLSKLREKGVKIVMGDFPVKNSKLENIFDYTLDGIKIDRALLSKIEKSTYTKIVSLLKDFAPEVTAEGVESEEEFDFIKNSGVDFVQGYYIGLPILENVFKEMQQY